MTEYSEICILEEKHILRILLYIRDHPGAKKTDLYDAISTNPRMPYKLDTLIDNGLITSTDQTKGVSLDLTDKGREVADHICGIHDILR